MTDKGAGKQRWWTLGAACSLHAILIGAGYMSLPPMALRIAAEGWALQDVERAWTLLPLGSAPAAGVTALLLRFIDERKLLALASIIGSITLLMRAAVVTYPQYAMSLAAYGIATGIVLTLLTVRVGRAFSDRQSGLAQALFFSSYAVGAAISLLGAEQIAASFGGWRSTQIFWGSLALIFSFWALTQSDKVEAYRSVGFSLPVEAAPRFRAFRYAATYAAYVGGYLGLSNFLPTALRQIGWPPVLADAALASSTIGFIVGALLWGVLTDRKGRQHRTFSMTMALTSAMLLLAWALAIEGQIWAASLSIFAIGLCSGGMSLYFSLLMTDPFFSGQNQTRVVANATAASYLGGFSIPFVVTFFTAGQPTFLAPIAFAASIASAALFLPKAASMPVVAADIA